MNKNFWKNKRVTITGGNGFLGKHVIRQLETRDVRNISIADKDKYDLTQLSDVVRMYDEQQPHIVIHLAAVVGGIGANLKNPGKFFYDNAIMGIQLIEYARKYNIEKFVCIGTICAYPKYTPIPFKEDDLWRGYPEETNAPYGIAKKMLLVQLQAYRQQYNFNGIYLLPVNLYGPGDNFNPNSSHVIPALIKKCVDAINANENEIVVWGTGEVSREFIYAEDAARGIIAATEKYNKSAPVNIGTGSSISINELLILIAKLTGFEGEIIWDNSMPDGQPNRMLDTNKAIIEFDFKSRIDFVDGLIKTINWYKENPN